MQGYDRQAAEAFMLERLKSADFKPIAREAAALVRRAIALDFEYMRASGVLRADGLSGEAYYDDDEAFEYIFDRMKGERGLPDDHPVQGALAAFIDQYMDLQQLYLEDTGLLGWE